MQDFVAFQYMGQGTNMQWVYAVQTDEDRAVHPAVPPYFNGLITAVNLEMMVHPELLDPPVIAEQWRSPKKKDTFMYLFSLIYSLYPQEYRR